MKNNSNSDFCSISVEKAKDILIEVMKECGMKIPENISQYFEKDYSDEYEQRKAQE